MGTVASVPWLTAARMRLFRAAPYLASAIYSVKVIETELAVVPGTDTPTMAVDQYWRMYIHPQLPDKWTNEEIAGVLYHEMCHLLRVHPDRCLEALRYPEIWNLAADAEINRGQFPDGVKLPPGTVTPETLGLPKEGLAEDYYDLLMKKIRDQCPVHGKKSKKNQDQKNEGQDGQSQDGQEGQDGHGHGRGPQCTCDKGGPQIGQPGGGQCGSAAHGQQMPYEDAPPTAGSDKGVTKQEAQRIRQDVANKVQEVQKQRGNVPGDWVRWAELHLAGSKVPWQKLLRSHLKNAIAWKAGQGYYTYSRPSRRNGCSGEILFPGQQRPIPNVAIIIDTSGSMGEEELSMILSEVRAVLKVTEQQGVFVIAVDAAVHWSGNVSNAKQVKLKGGGGTDMRVGFDFIDNMKKKPQVVVCATDCYSPFPETSPHGYSTVIVSTTDKRDLAPEWAKWVYLEK